MKLKRWHKRIIFLCVIFIFLSAALFFILTAFRDNIVFFFSPSELLLKKQVAAKDLRLGGIVKADSINIKNNKLEFIITDFEKEIPVEYDGVIPLLFKEESGTVALGRFKNGKFYAKELLAKHDENYMPKEVADSLKNRYKGL